MIKIILIYLSEIIIGFAGGMAVGGGFVAFLTLLGIIPRLAQLSKTTKLINVYGACVILGTQVGTYFTFTNIHFHQGPLLLMIWGSFHGIFIGMLAASLTEILNVFPIISKRIGMKQFLYSFLMAIVFGKVTGSLFQWLIFVK